MIKFRLPRVGGFGLYEGELTLQDACGCGKKHLAAYFVAGGKECPVQTMALQIEVEAPGAVAHAAAMTEAAYPDKPWEDDGYPDVWEAALHVIARHELEMPQKRFGCGS